MPTRVQSTKERINELHAFLDRGWRHQDGTLKKGYKIAAAEKFNVSDKTIFNILQQHPKPYEREPRTGNLTPSFTEEFLTLDAVKEMEKRKQGISRSKLQGYLAVGLKAWKILEKKHPMNWTEADFKLLWAHPDMKDEETGFISFGNASALRNWMQHLGLYDTLNSGYFDTKKLKRAAGKKLTHWVKTEEEFKAVIDGIRYPDTLILYMVGIQSGGRLSSHKQLTPEKISYADETIMMWEPKVKQWVPRDFLSSVLHLLRTFIVDIGITGKERVFTASNETINEDLKQAGKKAGLDFDLTSHVALKHTFVSFASNHGVPLQIVSQQTGTEPGTLMKFYAGVDRERTRHFLLGKTYKEPDYHEVMNRLNEYATARYQIIKTIRRGGAEANASKLAKFKATIKKRGLHYNWVACEAIIKNPNSPPTLKKAWTRLLELHRKGLSDTEIRDTIQREKAKKNGS
jgi:hypothetical protein